MGPSWVLLFIFLCLIRLIHRLPKFLLGAWEYHTWSYGPVLGPPSHRPICPSLPLRRLSLLLAPLLAPSHTSPPSFVSRLVFFCRYRSLGFSFFLLIVSFAVSGSSQTPLGPRLIRVSG